MKFFTVALLSALLLSTTSAQTRVGGVTLTPIGKTPVTPPAPATPNPNSTGTTRTSTSGLVPVPAGLRELRGRLTAPSEGTRLPAGSQIVVTIRNAASGAVVSSIKFSTTRLSTPYQMIFSPVRINPARRYVVKAEISDPNGKLIYSSADVRLPKEDRAVMNIPVYAR